MLNRVMNKEILKLAGITEEFDYAGGHGALSAILFMLKSKLKIALDMVDKNPSDASNLAYLAKQVREALALAEEQEGKYKVHNL